MSRPTKKPGLANAQHPIIPDFVQLLDAEEVDDQGLAGVLATTYNSSSQVYTWAGTQCLVAISPLRVPSLVADLQSSETKSAWYKQYKNTKCEPWTSPQHQGPSPASGNTRHAYRKPPTSDNAASAALPPHVFGLANDSYFQMRRTGNDQCVILSGESGSSKSFQVHLLLQQLCSLCGGTKRDEKIHERALAVPTVLNAFSSAASTVSVDTSKVGLVYEVLYSERGKMVGMRTVPYCLDKDRVLCQKQGERNFHAFYYLLAGAPLELRQELGLMPNAHYPYLNHGIAPLASIDDAGRFQHWQEAMRLVGLSKRHQFYIFKLLAAILHLGHIQFMEDGQHEALQTIVKNTEALAFVANLLEVDMDVMEAALTTKIKYDQGHRDMITELLTPQKAMENRDQLAKLLYNALFIWIVEFINKKLANVQIAVNFIGIVDFPGRPVSHSNDDYLSASNPTALQWRYCNERLEDFFYKRLFNYGNDQLREQGMRIMDAGYMVSYEASQQLLQLPKEVNAYPGIFVHLFRGGQGQGGSRAPMYQALFGQSVLDLQAFDSHAVALIKAPVLRPKPLLAAADTKASYNKFIDSEAIVEQMDSLVEELWKTGLKTLYCLRPNLDRTGTSLDQTHIADQLKRLQVGVLVRHLAKRNGANYNFRMDPVDFIAKYSVLFDLSQVDTTDPRALCSYMRSLQNMTEEDFFVGPNLVILRDEAFLHFERLLKLHELDKLPPELIGQDKDDATSVFSEATDMSDVQSNFENDSFIGDFPRDRTLRQNTDLNRMQSLPPERPLKNVTFLRRVWIGITFGFTWWIPSMMLRTCGGMKREDIQMAWREKVTIFMIILLCCAIQLFFIIGLGQVVCPRQNILNTAELYYKTTDSVPLVGIYGGVYDLNSFFSRPYHSYDLMRSFAGLDITAGFPRTPAYYCDYAKKNSPNFPPLFNNETTIANGTYIQVRHRVLYEQDLYGAQRLIDYSLQNNVKKLIGWDPKDVLSLSTSSNSGRLRKMFIIKERVYDIQPYIDTLGQATQDFFPAGLLDYLNSRPGIDLTSQSYFMNIWNSDKSLRNCFNNLFVVGVVDHRKSAQCLFSNYVLVAFSAFLALIIGCKFLAALQLSSPGSPEEHDKFVILQVPCYTENEESLKKTIDSLAVLEYDDKRKLLFLICDGNIMGSGNDRPTPRIVLDILGIPADVDPQPLAFQSIGEGSKQYNMGKVYSGLYGVQGHLVPYVVVVKVGMKNEIVRPGNRGKRDSQMILMRFLNKVCFDTPMSPLELELYHHIKNVIGVNPAFYEYCLMVDADTVVHPDSLIRLVSVMMHDTKVMGVCGETKLANEKDTWATMIQVYEYFISHHLAKAFESMFGSVTCLPGCFCMYRLRSPNRNSPLLVSNALIEAYGDCDVDTLHKKNLLSLGEDRYLTTLMLKNFPNMRTVFTADAKCETTAPERWSILLSQRRRWINSTVHNLLELLNISELCGFCCFSMRFVVFIDLIATLVQPAVVIYLGYLIYVLIAASLHLENFDFPMISLILLGVIYGLQAIIFLFKREWQHIGWMLIYLLAIPVFSFFIPLYSFWHMDDFSWGNTRRVLGDKNGKQRYVAGDTEVFNIRKIPHKKWSEAEAEKGKPSNANMATLDDGRSVSGRSIKSSRRIDRSDRSERGGEARRGASPSSSSLSPAPSRFPSDMELFKAIEQTLASSDLMTTTKKQIREQLSSHFNVDLTPKKDFINQCINEILSSRT